MNYNIQTLLRSLGNQQPQSGPQGIDPNLALVMQAMGMMPKQMDTQGRPIIPGQQNPSLMDQHYARQQNPGAMADRYGAQMFSQGPARVQGPQQQVTARQPIEGLPGQVGPAMGLRQTPVNMSPTADEQASMQGYRDAMKQALMPPTQASRGPAAPQGPPAPQMPAWQGPPMPDARQEAGNISDVARRQWEAGQRAPVPMPMFAGMPDLSGQVREMAPGTQTFPGPYNAKGPNGPLIAGFPDRSVEVRAMPQGSPTFNPFSPPGLPQTGMGAAAGQLATKATSLQEWIRKMGALRKSTVR